MADKDHILVLPSFVFAFRILQLIVAVVILGLAAYGITYFSFDGNDLSLFTVCSSSLISFHQTIHLTCYLL
jgi:ABC-type glycerol-3-phosphate transport system permease component